MDFWYPKVSTKTDKKSVPVLFGEMSFWGLNCAQRSQTGVKTELSIKNAPIKQKLCTQGFYEVENSMKLVIFEEI